MEHKKTLINGEWMDGTSGRILQMCIRDSLYSDNLNVEELLEQAN